jgi:hypothetical protein
MSPFFRAKGLPPEKNVVGKIGFRRRHGSAEPSKWSSFAAGDALRHSMLHRGRALQRAIHARDLWKGNDEG